MKEALVAKGPKVTIVDSPVPEPKDGQLLVKVVVSGSNPKDWKVPMWHDTNINQGDDVAGVVVRVGAGVADFRAGDRVAGMHEMVTPHGSYAEYAIVPALTAFLIPEAMSFEAAATVPLAALTAAVGLHYDLKLPTPWLPAGGDTTQAPTPTPTPLIVYGAASAVGAFAVQLARASGIHPIIAVAGASLPLVEALLDPSQGDVAVDYRGGEAAAVAALQAAVGERKVLHAFDAITDHGSSYIASMSMEPGGTITTVLPGTEDARVDARGVERTQTYVGNVHGKLQELGFVYSRYLGRALATGTVQAHPHEVVPGGLGGVQKGLTDLAAGKAHGVKYVFRVEETEGAGKDSV